MRPRLSLVPTQPSLLSEGLALLLIAAPTIATQVGSMMLGVVDTIMVGELGREAIGATALGNLWVFGTLVVGIGIVLGLDPIASQAHGAGDGRRVGAALHSAVVLAFIVSIPIAVVWLFTEPVLVLAGQDPGLARTAHDFVMAQLPGIPGFLVFVALRQYLQARGMVWAALAIIVLANGVNAFLNWVLIFGELGAPRLGVVGSGLATGLTRCFLPLALAAWIAAAKLHRGAWVPWSRKSFAWRGVAEIFRFGWPSGLQYGLEFWAFALSTLLAGLLGKAPLAGHTIVTNLASLAFMVPLGLSMAVSMRVGNLIGARDPKAAQRAAFVGFATTAALMLCLALAFVLLRGVLPLLYTNDVEVLELAMAALPIVATFQLFDGIQVVGGAILRAMGKNRPAVVFNAIGYYGIALPLGYALSQYAGAGLAGIWWAMCLGLAIVATSLVVWVARRGPAVSSSSI